MSIEQPSCQRSGLSWRNLFFGCAFAFVVAYVTQSLWLPLLAPWAIERARQATDSKKRDAWEFALQRATESNDTEPLLAVAREESAPGETRAIAWAAMAKRWEQSGERAKAADCYLSVLDCLISDRSLTAKGYKLREEVWDQLRFQLGTVIDRERYRAVLMSWAERTDDHRLLQQLVFELGKMQVLAKAEIIP